jgi:hypothetical protein
MPVVILYRHHRSGQVFLMSNFETIPGVYIMHLKIKDTIVPINLLCRRRCPHAHIETPDEQIMKIYMANAEIIYYFACGNCRKKLERLPKN